MNASAENEEYLRFRNAEGITFSATDVIFGERPSRAAVFEELIHTAQYANGLIDSSAISRARAEIAAKEKLLKYAKAYQLTETDIKNTVKLLGADRAWLRSLTGDE